VRRSRMPAAPQARARTAQRRPACLAAHQPVGVQDVEGVQEAVRDAAQHPSPLGAVSSARGLERARRSGAATVLVLAHLDGTAVVPGAPGSPPQARLYAVSQALTAMVAYQYRFGGRLDAALCVHICMTGFPARRVPGLQKH